MSEVSSAWQTLAPGNLPTKVLVLTFNNFDPQQVAQSFEFVGFVDMTGKIPSHPDAKPEATLHFVSPLCAENIVAFKGHFGTLFAIVIGPNSVRLEDYCYPSGDCQETAMKLLRLLIVERKLCCEWQAYSWYYDNHQYSEIKEGTEVEIRALYGL